MGIDEDAERVREVYTAREGDPELAAYYQRVAPALERLNAERRRPLLEVIDSIGPRSEISVLDVGCGEGGELAWLVSQGLAPANLAGVDLLDHAIARARERVPGVDLRVANAARLPFDDNSFDVVITVFMLSAILDPAVRAAAARELQRVARVELVLWELARGHRDDYRAVTPAEVRSWWPVHLRERVTLDIRIAGRLPGSVAETLSRIAPLRTHHVIRVPAIEPQPLP